MATSDYDCTLHHERRKCVVDELRHKCIICSQPIVYGQNYVSLCQIVYGLFNYKVLHADWC